jgi:alpha/beta superfamily hydrolase
LWHRAPFVFVQTFAALEKVMVCMITGKGKSRTCGPHGNGLLKEHADIAGHRWLGGFSFGGVMATHIAQQWQHHDISQGQPNLDRVILVGLGLAEDRRGPAPLTAQARLIHGEHDEVVSLGAVTNWVAAQRQPVLVMPHAGHFFHGQLPLLKECITRCLLA